MNQTVRLEGIKKTLFGAEAINQIGEACRALRAPKALLVMDRELSRTDICQRVLAILKKARIKTFLFPDVRPEPDPELADIGATLAKEEKVRCVIAVGGGSTMDVAKAVAMLVTNGGKTTDYIGLGLVNKPGLPTIMVPTTAGTGSEVTFTAVFTMRETRTKGGINSPFLYAHTAILDPELTLGLSPELTAVTGMNALTHALESFTSRHSNFMSEPIALSAIEMIASNLRGAVFKGEQCLFRENMMKGSYMAGLGLAMSGVGAVHAFAYPLGAMFDVPHGLANAVMLPYVLAYNVPGDIGKFCQIAWAMDEPESGGSDRDYAYRAVRAVFDLSADIGIPGSLEEIGIPEEALPEMAKAALKVETPILNNPRPVTVNVIQDIYKNAFKGEHIARI